MKETRAIILTLTERLKFIEHLIKKQKHNTSDERMKYTIEHILKTEMYELDGDTIWIPVSPHSRIGHGIHKISQAIK